MNRSTLYSAWHLTGAPLVQWYRLRPFRSLLSAKGQEGSDEAVQCVNTSYLGDKYWNASFAEKAGQCTQAKEYHSEESLMV